MKTLSPEFQGNNMGVRYLKTFWTMKPILLITKYSQILFHLDECSNDVRDYLFTTNSMYNKVFQVYQWCWYNVIQEPMTFYLRVMPKRPDTSDDAQDCLKQNDSTSFCWAQVYFHRLNLVPGNPTRSQCLNQFWARCTMYFKLKISLTCIGSQPWHQW